MSTGFLIVEDDPSVARTLERVFRRQRPVQVVSTVAEAREALAQSKTYTGVILDLVLPDGFGLDLLEELRTNNNPIPVLVLTGELNRDVVNRVQALRAEYVCKPASNDNLQPFIQHALASERVGDETISKRIEQLSRQLGLTRREAELLTHAVEGLSRRDLARALGVAENTVKAQIRSLLKKSGARSIATLAQQVLRGPES